jgi:L-serine dehydratase
MIVSIFNDVIGPVMRGPSSSHCAAALRIGRMARDLMGGEIEEVLVEFDRAGSLPTTHDTQGSDMGLFGGLMGWDAADERLPGSMEVFAGEGRKIRIETVDVGDPHPNTYRLTLFHGGESHSLHAISTGGGMMEVILLDGVPVSMFGDCHETLIWTDDVVGVMAVVGEGMEVDGISEVAPGLVEVKAGRFVEGNLLEGLAGVRKVRFLGPVLPVMTRKGTAVPFTTAAELLGHDGGRGIPLWRHAVAYEGARGNLTDEEVLGKMVELVRILRRSIAAGLAGTSYEDRVLGFQSGGYRREMDAGRLLEAGALNRIILYVTALMEVKSSMGVIIAMPTAGACAALPGAVIAMAEEMGLDEEAMARALMASGAIGVFIATAWSFAAEVGGCQAEGGSAASMAAAALVTLAGGTLEQALAASSMALQSMIGLVCDPIANRVEAPCLGKNVMAAANALSCANMALAGFDQVIPLDEVIETAKRVSKQMPRELRCTALGGLSITPTSLAIEKRLAEGRAACGKGSCGCG